MFPAFSISPLARLHGPTDMGRNLNCDVGTPPVGPGRFTAALIRALQAGLLLRRFTLPHRPFRTDSRIVDERKNERGEMKCRNFLNNFSENNDYYSGHEVVYE